jgi:hypothetical protein
MVREGCRVHDSVPDTPSDLLIAGGISGRTCRIRRSSVFWIQITAKARHVDWKLS